MGDFIKDLNIIDFLGMLLPGAFVALCLSIQHPGAWQILETAIGCELSLSLRITVVLVVGYVIGMLLHELGSSAPPSCTVLQRSVLSCVGTSIPSCLSWRRLRCSCC